MQTGQNQQILKKHARMQTAYTAMDFISLDIHVLRTMILIVFEDNEATVIWTGSHDEYDKTFKGNKKTIEKWLRNQQLI